MEYGAKISGGRPSRRSRPGALPTYGLAVRLGELNQVADNPSFVEAKASGDNNATARMCGSSSRPRWT